MKKQIFLAIFILSICISFVYAQEIPSAPEPVLPSLMVSCLDTDEGLDYSTYGNLILEKISLEVESSMGLPEDRFDYCQIDINKKQSCEHPEREILMEAYCSQKTADLMKESIIAFKEYNCTTEGKVCYYGRCIEKNELEKDTKYIQDKENCKREENAVMRFFKKVYTYFNPEVKQVKSIEKLKIKK